eukprot:12236312-Alexandrium_andersonii.AAC.1
MHRKVQKITCEQVAVNAVENAVYSAVAVRTLLLVELDVVTQGLPKHFVQLVHGVGVDAR